MCECMGIHRPTMLETPLVNEWTNNARTHCWSIDQRYTKAPLVKEWAGNAPMHCQSKLRPTMPGSIDLHAMDQQYIKTPLRHLPLTMVCQLCICTTTVLTTPLMPLPGVLYCRGWWHMTKGGPGMNITETAGQIAPAVGRTIKKTGVAVTNAMTGGC